MQLLWNSFTAVVNSTYIFYRCQLIARTSARLSVALNQPERERNGLVVAGGQLQCSSVLIVIDISPRLIEIAP